MEADQSRITSILSISSARETPLTSVLKSTTKMKLMIYQEGKRKKLNPQLLLRFPKWQSYMGVLAIWFASNSKFGKNHSRIPGMILWRSQECWNRNDYNTGEFQAFQAFKPTIWEAGFRFLSPLIPTSPPD